MCPLEDSTTEKHPRAIDSIPEQNRQAIKKNTQKMASFQPSY